MNHILIVFMLLWSSGDLAEEKDSPESVRLVNGTTLCTGRMEVKANESWSSVCKGDFDCQDASVVCRELGCGVPLKLQFYENMMALKGTKQFQCRGSESTLLDCESYESARKTCSSTVLTCLDLLFQPMISVSPSGVYESSDFTISCSIKPQYPGGSFQLTFNTSNTANTYTQKAVNHTAHFLFPAANHGHQGNYSCVYHVYIFSHKLSSESQPLYLSISACPTVFIVRLVGLLLTLALLLSAIGFHTKTTRGQGPGGQENKELDYCNLGASAKGGPNEEDVIQGTHL